MTCSIFLGSLCVAAWVQPSRRQAQSAPHSQISSHATCFQTTRSIHWRSSTEFAWAVTTGRGRQRCMLSVWTTRGKNISQLWINTEKLFIWDLFGRVSDSIQTLACYLKALNQTVHFCNCCCTRGCSRNIQMWVTCINARRRGETSQKETQCAGLDVLAGRAVRYRALRGWGSVAKRPGRCWLVEGGPAENMWTWTICTTCTKESNKNRIQQMNS